MRTLPLLALLVPPPRRVAPHPPPTPAVGRPGGARGRSRVVVRGGSSWGRGRGAPTRRYKAYTDRGYAVAEFSWNAVAADVKGPRKGGVYTLFGDDLDTGTLMGWA